MPRGEAWSFQKLASCGGLKEDHLDSKINRMLNGHGLGELVNKAIEVPRCHSFGQCVGQHVGGPNVSDRDRSVSYLLAGVVVGNFDVFVGVVLDRIISQRDTL